MYTRDSNGIEQQEEINLMPNREIRKMGFDMSDFYLFCILVLPVVMFAFIIGWNLAIGIIFALYVLFCVVLCFMNSKTSGKMRTRARKFIAKGLFGKKYYNENEIKSFTRIKEVIDNHVRYKNKEQEGYVSIYRISGYDLSLCENATQNQVIEYFSQFWGHRSDFDIVSLGVQYQIPPKKYKQTKTTPDLEKLKKAYDAKIEQMNNDTKNKQHAYFLILNGTSIEANQQHFDVLQRLILDAKISLTEANTSEITQIINSLWPETSFDAKLPSKLDIKAIRVYKNYLKIYHVDDSYELIGFKCINTLPGVATRNYLRTLFNDTNYTLYTSTKILDSITAKNVLRNAQSFVARIISSKWYDKRASDAQRAEIDKVDVEIQQISEQMIRESHIYELREMCMYFIFKASTRKELNAKMLAFDKKIIDFGKGFIINDLDYFQMDAFINTRMYELPQFQYRKSFMESLKNNFRGKARKVNVAQLPMEIVRDNAIHVLNTSLALGYPFSNNVSVGDENCWYRGKFIDYSGISALAKPIFENYWKINSNYNLFNRIYLAISGAGKTTTCKRDQICDYLDDCFIFCIDPKPDYGSMAKALGGRNIILGQKPNKDKTTNHLNIWDVVNVPINLNENNQEIALSPLDKTYIKNDAVITALLNVTGKSDEEELMAAWRKVQKFVYEDPKGKCKFTHATEFENIDKKQMPITQDFYDCALNFSKQQNMIGQPAMKKLATLLEQYSKNSTYGYLFNTYSNVGWTDATWFNLDISNIARTRDNIFGAWLIYLLEVAMELMLMNKFSKRRFALYNDEFHRVRHIPGVLTTMNTFARICRSHSGCECIIDQGFGVIAGEADRKYKEIFEQIQYQFYFNSPENDINKIEDMMQSSGRPISEIEHKFIARAKPGECLSVMSAWDRYRLSNDVSHWWFFLKEVRSEGTFN